MKLYEIPAGSLVEDRGIRYKVTSDHAENGTLIGLYDLVGCMEVFVSKDADYHVVRKDKR